MRLILTLMPLMIIMAACSKAPPTCILPIVADNMMQPPAQTNLLGLPSSNNDSMTVKQLNW